MSVEDSYSSQWWRWPLVPVAATIGSVLGSRVVMVLAWFGFKRQGASEDDWMYQYILPATEYGVFGFLFVYIACAVAPRGKVITATVMATLLVLISIANILVIWGLRDYETGVSITRSVGSVIGSISAISAVMLARSEHG